MRTNEFIMMDARTTLVYALSLLSALQSLLTGTKITSHHVVDIVIGNDWRGKSS